MVPAQPGSQARALRMRLCGADGLSSALLPLACSKSGVLNSVWDSPLPSITLEVFISLTRWIKMFLVLD